MSKFLRQDTVRHIKFNRRRSQAWRRPKGIHSKMRKRRNSYPKVVVIGYKSQIDQSGKIDGLNPVLVHNSKELLALNKNSLAIIAKIGAKKRIELIKLAQENKIKLLNVKGEKSK